MQNISVIDRDCRPDETTGYAPTQRELVQMHDNPEEQVSDRETSNVETAQSTRVSNVTTTTKITDSEDVQIYHSGFWFIDREPNGIYAEVVTALAESVYGLTPGA